MTAREAVDLIRDAIPGGGSETWADLGCGEGLFTRALVERLGSGGRVFAVDRDAGALATLDRWAKRVGAPVTVARADFTRSFELPGTRQESLDGILLANALHYVKDQGTVLGRLAHWLRPGGRVVLVEYDRRLGNPWVPHPIPIAGLAKLANAAGLTPPVVTATRPSAFGGELYVAWAGRAAEGGPAG